MSKFLISFTQKLVVQSFFSCGFFPKLYNVNFIKFIVLQKLFVMVVPIYEIKLLLRYIYTIQGYITYL